MVTLLERFAAPVCHYTGSGGCERGVIRRVVMQCLDTVRRPIEIWHPVLERQVTTCMIPLTTVNDLRGVPYANNQVSCGVSSCKECVIRGVKKEIVIDGAPVRLGLTNISYVGIAAQLEHNHPLKRTYAI